MRTCASLTWPQLVGMRLKIPSDAEVVDLPYVGQVVVFPHGSAWLAVRPSARDSEQVVTGCGDSRGEAVAALIEEER